VSLLFSERELLERARKMSERNGPDLTTATLTIQTLERLSRHRESADNLARQLNNANDLLRIVDDITVQTAFNPDEVIEAVRTALMPWLLNKIDTGQ
jgi:hypothetical protein